MKEISLEAEVALLQKLLSPKFYSCSWIGLRAQHWIRWLRVDPSPCACYVFLLPWDAGPSHGWFLSSLDWGRGGCSGPCACCPPSISLSVLPPVHGLPPLIPQVPTSMGQQAFPFWIIYFGLEGDLMVWRVTLPSRKSELLAPEFCCLLRLPWE